jgi:hypothetical protein
LSEAVAARETVPDTEPEDGDVIEIVGAVVSATGIA